MQRNLARSLLRSTHFDQLPIQVGGVRARGQQQARVAWWGVRFFGPVRANQFIAFYRILCWKILARSALILFPQCDSMKNERMLRYINQVGAENAYSGGVRMCYYILIQLRE